jgi:hypothetical protein
MDLCFMHHLDLCPALIIWADDADKLQGIFTRMRHQALQVKAGYWQR